MTPPGPARLPGALLDTNVLLDVVLARAPHDREAVLLLDAIARGRARGWVAAHAVTTVHDLVERERDRAAATAAVGDLLALLAVAEVGGGELQRALAMGLRDFEDAVQAAACLRVGADVLVTRNARDFRRAPVATATAGEFLARLAIR